MTYIQLEVPEYSGPAHILAVEAARIITAVSGVEPDEDGRVEGPADLDDVEKRIVQVAMGLVDLCYDRPLRVVGDLAVLLRTAADLLSASDRPVQELHSDPDVGRSTP